MSTPTAPDVVIYPSEDGEPMAETPIHVAAIMLLFQALQDFCRPRPDIYLAADMFWYWEEGNPNARRAPDVMAIKGVGQAERRSFFSWRENGAVPHVIFEMASESTWREDLDEKRRLYARLGVREYFIFDPEGEYLRPRLRGFRLNDRGRYDELDADAMDRQHCLELGLLLQPEGTMLRLIDASTGQVVLSHEERAEQEYQRAEQEYQRAEQERHRTELAQQQAEQERQRADSLAAEVARLREQLARLQPPPGP